MFKLVNGVKILMTQEEEKAFLFKRKEKTLEELKEEKIQQLKTNSYNYIISKYPYFKQLNIMRIGTEEEKNNMSSFIDGVRDKVNQLELDINSCSSEKKINKISISCENWDFEVNN